MAVLIEFTILSNVTVFGVIASLTSRFNRVNALTEMIILAEMTILTGIVILN